MNTNQSEHPDIPRSEFSSEVLEWARQTLNVEDFLAHLREIKSNQGIRLEDFIDEVDAIVRSK